MLASNILKPVTFKFARPNFTPPSTSRKFALLMGAVCTVSYMYLIGPVLGFVELLTISFLITWYTIILYYIMVVFFRLILRTWLLKQTLSVMTTIIVGTYAVLCLSGCGFSQMWVFQTLQGQEKGALHLSFALLMAFECLVIIPALWHYKQTPSQSR